MREATIGPEASVVNIMIEFVNAPSVLPKNSLPHKSVLCFIFFILLDHNHSCLTLDRPDGLSVIIS